MSEPTALDRAFERRVARRRQAERLKLWSTLGGIAFVSLGGLFVIVAGLTWAKIRVPLISQSTNNAGEWNFKELAEYLSSQSGKPYTMSVPSRGTAVFIGFDVSPDVVENCADVYEAKVLDLPPGVVFVSKKGTDQAARDAAGTVSNPSFYWKRFLFIAGDERTLSIASNAVR